MSNSSSTACNANSTFGTGDGELFDFGNGTCWPIWLVITVAVIVCGIIILVLFCVRRHCRRGANQLTDPLVVNAEEHAKSRVPMSCSLKILCCGCKCEEPPLTPEEEEEIAKEQVYALITTIQDDTDNGGVPKPEHVRIVKEIGKKYVVPGCSKSGDPAWWGAKGPSMKDFGNSGACQQCKKPVATENHGLHCCNRGHHICWSCMAKGINWEEALRDPVQKEILLGQINDNLAIDAREWRARRAGRV